MGVLAQVGRRAPDARLVKGQNIEAKRWDAEVNKVNAVVVEFFDGVLQARIPAQNGQLNPRMLGEEAV